MNPNLKNDDKLGNFGFNFTSLGVHASRTLMVDELRLLLNEIGSLEANLNDYFTAIVNDNCLQKRSVQNRNITFTKLKILYALDNNITIFRILNYLYRRDPESLPLLAILCASCRDQLVRELTPFVLSAPIGSYLSRISLEEYISDKYQGRFSSATLCSTSQNINASWTQVGYLEGRSRKFRIKIFPSSVTVSYALLLGFLNGSRGFELFDTIYSSFLDTSKSTLITLAEEASRKGWIYMKRLGDVVEINFNQLLTSKERDLLHD